MSGRPWWVRSRGLLNSATQALLGWLCLVCLATSGHAQQRREREPSSVYAERRAKLAAQVDGPVVLWGFTGREEVSQAYVFAQEDNFYYLTGHNEEGAGLILLPAPKQNTGGAAGPGDPAPRDSSSYPHEILFLPTKDPAKEKWNGVRMSPGDPDIE